MGAGIRSSKQAHAETSILKAICGLQDGALRANLLRKLEDVPWQSPENRILFEAIREVLRHSETLDAPALHHHIHAQLTRMGFPDVDFEWDVHAPPLAERKIKRLLKELAAGRRSADSACSVAHARTKKGASRR
jgi:hypothetical protein